MTEEQKPLTPPDIEQCQAEKPSGYTFMTFGGQPGEMIRCEAPTEVIVFELKPGKDGRRGSMSLCGECLTIMCGQMDMTTMAVFRRESSEAK
jgi:hypothetical protein